MAVNNEIPDNADKLLFAEDLVSYMMDGLGNVQCPHPSAAPFREFIYKGFNQDTKSAICFIQRRMAIKFEENYRSMRNENAVNGTTYRNLANNIKQRYFVEGFDASYFLHFCAYLVSLATYFYLDGVQEAPSLAILYIYKAFQGFDMVAGGWDTLNRIAQWYGSMLRDTVEELSPPTSDDEITEDIENELPD